MKLLGSAEIIHGTIWVRLSRAADPTRKRIRIEDPAIVTLDDARELAHRMTLAAIESRIVRVAPPAEGSPSETVAQWYERWHEDRAARQAVTTTRHDRGRLAKHVLPLIGKRPMRLVSREEIEGVVSVLDAKIVGGEISWKTAATTWGCVTKGFRDAVASKTLTLRVRGDDPTLGVRPPERGAEKSKAFLYPSEFWTLITSRKLTHGEGLDARVAANVARAMRRWLRAFTLATYLGTRAGELGALDWE